MNLSISDRQRAKARQVVHVGGDLDVYTAPRLKEALAEAIGWRQDRSSSISPRCTSSIPPLWACWWRACSRAQAADGEFRLVMDDPYLLKIFRITGFDGVFSIFPAGAPDALVRRALIERGCPLRALDCAHRRQACYLSPR